MERPRKHDAMLWALSLLQEEQRYGRWGVGLRGRNVLGPRETQGLDASPVSKPRGPRVGGEAAQGTRRDLARVDIIKAAGDAM